MASLFDYKFGKSKAKRGTPEYAMDFVEREGIVPPKAMIEGVNRMATIATEKGIFSKEYREAQHDLARYNAIISGRVERSYAKKYRDTYVKQLTGIVNNIWTDAISNIPTISLYEMADLLPKMKDWYPILKSGMGADEEFISDLETDIEDAFIAKYGERFYRKFGNEFINAYAREKYYQQGEIDDKLLDDAIKANNGYVPDWYED